MSATESIKQRMMHRLARGEVLAAFAVHEAASGVIATAIETKATRDGEEYILDGSKIFTTSGGEADIYVVLARYEKGSGFVLLGVDKDTNGFAVGRIDERMGLRGVSSREIRFERVHVPTGYLLGQEGAGLQIVGKVVGEVALLGTAAIAVGISQAALDLSVEHAKSRTISGKPIGQTAAIKQRIASMSVTVE
jgi:alkylation response protein AidB-like acyl-CoA dehydrogenase